MKCKIINRREDEEMIPFLLRMQKSYRFPVHVTYNRTVNYKQREYLDSAVDSDISVIHLAETMKDDSKIGLFQSARWSVIVQQGNPYVLKEKWVSDKRGVSDISVYSWEVISCPIPDEYIQGVIDKRRKEEIEYHNYA